MSPQIPNYFMVIPSYIATRKDLLEGDIVFYGRISSLCNKYGYSWASNEYLASITGKSTRQVKRHIRKLRDLQLIFVEIEYNNDRKIWTRETWPHREELKKCFNQDLALNQRFDRWDMDVLPSGHGCPPNNITIYKYKEKVGKEESVRETKHQPRQASAPTSFLNSKKKNTEQKIPRPPPPKKPPDKPPQKKCGVLEEHEYQKLCDVIPDKKIRQRYMDNAKNFVSKKHHNAYSDMSLFDIIMKFYREDQQTKLNHKDKVKNEKLSNGSAITSEIMKNNPSLTSEWQIEAGYVVVAQSPSSGDICIRFDDPNLEEKLIDRLDKMSEYFRFKEQCL